jgi:hypothetical protein
LFQLFGEVSDKPGGLGSILLVNAHKAVAQHEDLCFGFVSIQLVGTACHLSRSDLLLLQAAFDHRRL